MRELGGRREKNRFEREKEREGEGEEKRALGHHIMPKYYNIQHSLQLRVRVLFIGLECKLTLMTLLSLTSN